MSPRSLRRRARTAPQPSALASAPVGSDGITSYRWVWYLLSVFVPYAGILVALFLYDQDSWDVRKIGRNCLLISFIIWVLFPILVFLMMVLITVLVMAGMVSNAISPTD